jgi:hypothetical protein
MGKITKRIEQAYLMWVGSEHYPTIEKWTSEAAEMGVSKRLPSLSIGKKMMEPGTIVFVAHDEGRMVECEGCAGKIDCPECRKRDAEILREQAKVAHFTATEKTALAERAKERIELIKAQKNTCSACRGRGRTKAGTGGKVLFKNGEKWDYRKYNYHLHQPKVWTPEGEWEVVEKNMCEDCGGTGKLPDGKVFGIFLPENMEFITMDEEVEGAAEAEEAATAAGAIVVPYEEIGKEKKRGCGKRKAGGVYVSTSPDAKSKKKLTKIAGELGVEADAIEIHGNFASFLKPVAIPGVKRFRGIASAAGIAKSVMGRLTAEADMAKESLED